MCLLLVLAGTMAGYFVFVAAIEIYTKIKVPVWLGVLWIFFLGPIAAIYLGKGVGCHTESGSDCTTTYDRSGPHTECN